MGVAFALIEASLLVRLVLPYVDTVPKALRGLVPPLIEFTDRLMAPFKGITQPFNLGRLVDLPSGVTSFLSAYTDRIDPAVVVAMIAWGLIGAVVLLGLRLVLRP